MADCRLEAKASRRQHYTGVHSYALIQDVPLTDYAPCAEHREAADDDVLSDPGSLADDRAAHDSPCLDLGALEQDAALDNGALPRAAPRPQRGPTADRRPGLDLAPRRNRDRRQELHVLALGNRGIDLAVLESLARGAHGTREHVVRGGQVTARRPDVPPVRAGDVSPQLSHRLEIGEDLALYRDLLVRRDHLENLGLEHVDPGVYQVRRDLVGGRLLDKAAHDHVVVY